MSISDLIEFSDGTNTLYGTWGVPSGVDSYPLVILATGDGPSGSKGQTWQQLIPMLLAKGIGTFLFDFSGLGNSPGVYRELNLSLGCTNFRGVINFVLNNGTENLK